LKALPLLLLLLVSATALASQNSASPEALIEAEYRQYIRDFIAKDYEAIASHFNPPIQTTNAERSLVLQTTEEIKRMYQNMMANIQKGYSYSEVDSIDIQPLSRSTYAASVSFTRYNTKDEAIFEGRSTYLFGNQSGEWKMFSMIQADR
jgi:ketosteroid isomerase-like protein